MILVPNANGCTNATEIILEENVQRCKGENSPGRFAVFAFYSKINECLERDSIRKSPEKNVKF